jgi:cytochrome b6-f complex iron-sulfur subunit
MVPMTEEEKAERIAAAKARAAEIAAQRAQETPEQREARLAAARARAAAARTDQGSAPAQAAAPAATATAPAAADGSSPHDRFVALKAAQKEKETAVAQAGPGADALVAAQREAVISRPTPKEAAPGAPPLLLNRREFLMYAWGASIALLLAGSGISTFFFILPRFKAGEFGGTFSVPVSQFPAEGAPPIPNDEGKYWLVHTQQGYNVLYKVCTHLGCLYKWENSTDRFECPCHGSKFHLDGTYIEGPAPRNLDRFKLAVVDGSGTVIAQNDAKGDPIPVSDPNAVVQIDTGSRIKGQPKA